MSDQSTKMYALISQLRESIEEAEHKPGDWATALSQMGGIASPSQDRNEAVAQMLGGAGEQCWAGFSFKRDGWLAVAAVNALPALLALARGVTDLVQNSPDAAPALRELLEDVSQLVRSEDGAQCIEQRGVPLEATPVAESEVVEESEGAQLIATERRRQQLVKGWTRSHDDQHTDCSMALVAALYATPIQLYTLSGGNGSFHFVDPWPESWSGEWDKRRVGSDGRPRKRSVDEVIRDLSKAGALAAAEIDRLLRQKRRGRHGKRSRSHDRS